MPEYTLCADSNFDEENITKAWQSVFAEANQRNSVFLDWFWIGNWLKQVKPLGPICVTVLCDDRIVGMGFVCFHTRIAFGLPIKQGFLHRTGRWQYDQPWIEFNDLLTSPLHEQQCKKLFLSWCEKQPVDEWVIALSSQHKDWQDSARFNIELTSIQSYAVLLQPEFANLGQYIQTLSSNGRSTLRRALRFFEKSYGDLRYEVVRGQLPKCDEKTLMNWHRDRWKKDPQGSGFNNDLFIDFHHNLQAQSHASSHTETLVFYAGEKKLGYLYNLIHNKHVYFYLSAIDYSEKNNRYQPGLVMHAFAVSYYAKEGMEKYDFMGGDSRYKRSLANHNYALWEIILRPKTLKNTGFNILRKVKDLFLK